MDLKPGRPAEGGCPVRAFPLPLAATLALVGFAQVPSGGLVLMALENDRLSLRSFTAHMGTLAPLMAADFDGDDQIETLDVTGGRALLTRDGREIWSSPTAWDVWEGRITDLDRDGSSEISLLVWREFAPWPIDAYIPRPGRIASFHDRSGRSCHLILIGWRGSEFGELWAGSALSHPLAAFEAADLDGDGEQELVTLEGSYNQSRSSGYTVGVWEWNGFGFTLRARSTRSSFTRVAVLLLPDGSDAVLGERLLWR
jgi:hypothetical protein